MKVPSHDRCYASPVQAASMDMELKPEGGPQLHNPISKATHTTVYPCMVFDWTGVLPCRLPACTWS